MFIILFNTEPVAQKNDSKTTNRSVIIKSALSIKNCLIRSVFNLSRTRVAGDLYVDSEILIVQR